MNERFVEELDDPEWVSLCDLKQIRTLVKTGQELGIDLIDDALEVFEENLCAETAGLEQAIRRRDFQKISRISHVLKGACATMGVKRLRETFADLEKDPSIAIDIDSLKALSRRSVAALKTVAASCERGL